MNYWKTLDARNYLAIQNDFLLYLQSKDLIHVEGDIAEPLDVNECMEAVPLLGMFLEENGISKVTKIDLSRYRKTFTSASTGSLVISNYKFGRARVEIPLMGGDCTTHVFYRARIKEWKTQSNGVGFWVCEEEGAQEVARVKITRPMVIRTNVAHRIEFERTFVDRLSISLRTEPNAITLLEQPGL